MKENCISIGVNFNPRDKESFEDLAARALGPNPGYMLAEAGTLHSVRQIFHNAELWQIKFWLEPIEIDRRDENKALRNEMNSWRQKYYDLKNRIERTLKQ